MGCGRVGSSLALSLESQGHDVAIIDQEESAFRRLGPTSRAAGSPASGSTGTPCTRPGSPTPTRSPPCRSGDNSNILAARVARETFGVEHVVARIYDPGRAEVYQRLGIPTVATVRWTADQMLRRLLPQGHVPELRDPSGNGRHRRGHRQPRLGRPAASASSRTPPAPAPRYLTRLGAGSCRRRTRVFQEGDLLHLASLATELPAVERTLDAPPAATVRAPSRRNRMRVVIAGAGSVGRSIARELLHNGHQVLLMDKERKDVQASKSPRRQLAARRRLRDHGPARGRTRRVRRRRRRDR